jgi:hypothetical protein
MFSAPSIVVHRAPIAAIGANGGKIIVAAATPTMPVPIEPVPTPISTPFPPENFLQNIRRIMQFLIYNNYQKKLTIMATIFADCQVE